ncbi:MAG: HAD-IIB family hydrolase [Anaerolineae bacterium]
MASDIDHTLTGDPQALATLKTQLTALRQQKRLFLFLSTGRRLDQVLAGFERENIPAADAIISQVGTEIYLPPFSAQMRPLPTWNTFLHQRFSRQKALRLLEGIEGLEMQPEEYNTPLKVSCYLDRVPDPDRAAAFVEQRAAAAGGAYQVVWSSRRDLDIIPAAAGKGKAVRFLVGFLQLPLDRVVVAGDSGNDRSMFDEFRRGIIVSNAQPELKRLAAEPRTSFYFAEHPFAGGVEEGLRYFGVL